MEARHALARTKDVDCSYFFCHNVEPKPNAHFENPVDLVAFLKNALSRRIKLPLLSFFIKVTLLTAADSFHIP